MPSAKYVRIALDSARGQVVVEDDGLDPHRGVEISEDFRPIRAVDDVELVNLVVETEVRQEQAHLVAIGPRRASCRAARGGNLVGAGRPAPLTAASRGLDRWGSTCCN